MEGGWKEDGGRILRLIENHLGIVSLSFTKLTPSKVSFH
jgi:hypothetical protein